MLNNNIFMCIYLKAHLNLLVHFTTKRSINIIFEPQWNLWIIKKKKKNNNKDKKNHLSTRPYSTPSSHLLFEKVKEARKS